MAALLSPTLALACGDHRPLGSPRDPGFVASSERVQGSAVWLDYEVAMSVSARALMDYAERRSRELCGHRGWRWLDTFEKRSETTDTRLLHVVVDCQE